jgi:hypothetical protein
LADWEIPGVIEQHRKMDDHPADRLLLACLRELRDEAK